MEKGTENTRVTLIGIIVEDPEAAIRINGLYTNMGNISSAEWGYLIMKADEHHQCGHGCPPGKSQCPVGEAGNDPRSQHEVSVCPGRAKSPKIKRLSNSSNLCYNCKNDCDWIQTRKGYKRRKCYNEFTG